MGFLFVFIDGIGIGKTDMKNPFFRANPKILKLWNNSKPDFPGLSLKPIDPLLGIKGIPQSATGQTSIFTGKNIPALFGKHFGSFPNKKLRSIIKKENLLQKLINTGKKTRFINAYPHHSDLFSNSNVIIDFDGGLKFSDKFPEKFKKRISVTSSIIISNNEKPFDTDDIRNGDSLYQDFSNLSLQIYGIDLPVYSAREASLILSKIMMKFDFSLYEYFQSDIFGHRKSIDDQIDLVKDIDEFLFGILSNSDRNIDTILITSDHGNLEDSGSKTHSLNPVPLITWGKHSDELQGAIENISDITPAILKALT